MTETNIHLNKLYVQVMENGMMALTCVDCATVVFEYGARTVAVSEINSIAYAHAQFGAGVKDASA
jgi:hypothetical protein